MLTLEHFRFKGKWECGGCGEEKVVGKFVWPSAFMEETKAMRKRVASDEVIAPLPVSVLKIISPVTPGRLLLQFPKVTSDRNTFLTFNAHLVDGTVYFLSFKSLNLSLTCAVS